jgi:hypothetical protein
MGFKFPLITSSIMTAIRYCYHCGIQHPEEEMRQISTKGGLKWRCIKSIKAIKKTVAERDAFGRNVSAINAELASSKQLGRLSKDP